MDLSTFSDACQDCGNPHDQACPPECPANQDPPPPVPVFRRDDGTELRVSELSWIEAPNDDDGAHVWICGSERDDLSDMYLLRGAEAARWKSLFVPDPSHPLLRRAGPVHFLCLREGLYLNLARMEEYRDAEVPPRLFGAREVGLPEGWHLTSEEIEAFRALRPAALAARGVPVLLASRVAGAEVRRVAWDALPKGTKVGHTVRLDWEDRRIVGVAMIRPRPEGLLEIVVR